MGNVVATDIGILTNEDLQRYTVTRMQHPCARQSRIGVVSKLVLLQHENMDRDRLCCLPSLPYDRSRAAGLLICNRTRRVQLRALVQPLVHSVDLSARGNVWNSETRELTRDLCQRCLCIRSHDRCQLD